MPRILSLLIICSLLSLSLIGCIQFQDRPLDPADSAFQIETRTLSSEGLREFIENTTGRETSWPFQAWDVDQLTLAGMYYHPDLTLARARVRLAMLEAWAAKESERLLQQAMTERLEQQLSAGEIMRQEVIRSHLALNQQQLNVSAARKRNAESRVMIAVAIGVPVDVLSEIDLDFTKLSTPPVLSATPIQNLKEIAFREVPEVLAALADYEAAQSALQIEIANQYPKIQANPGYAWNLGEHRWALGTILELPILHHNQGFIAEAEAARLLGIHRSQLYVKFKELGIAPEEGTPLPEERDHS